MTPQEIAEIRELAGLNELSVIQQQKKWADKQLTNQPKISNQSPIPTAEQFGIPTIYGSTYGGNSNIDKELENLAERLNKKLGHNFSSDIKIERL